MKDEQIKQIINTYYKKSKRTTTIVGIVMFFIIFPPAILLPGFIPEDFSGRMVVIAICYIVVLVIGVVVENKIRTSLTNRAMFPVTSVLNDQCDSKSYLSLTTEGCQRSEYARNAKNFMVTLCIGANRIENNLKKAKELFNDAEYQRYLRRDKITAALFNFRFAIDENNNDDVELYHSNLLTLMKGKQPQLAKKVELDYTIYKKDYEKALLLMNEFPNSTKYREVTHAFLKGKCLYELKRKDEAKSFFEEVVENGNTLPYVEESKKYLKRIG